MILEYLTTMSKGILIFLHHQCSWHELMAFFTVVNYAYYIVLLNNYWLLFAAVENAFWLALLTTTHLLPLHYSLVMLLTGTA